MEHGLLHHLGNPTQYSMRRTKTGLETIEMMIHCSRNVPKRIEREIEIDRERERERERDMQSGSQDLSFRCDRHCVAMPI